MVSVVTGSGNGLVNTSKDVLGAAAGAWGQASSGRAGEQITVNAANGNLIVQDRDEFLAGIGPDIDLLRTYNSLGSWDGDNGDSWRIGFYRRVWGGVGDPNTASSTIKRTDPDGHESTYYFNASQNKYFTAEGSGQFDSLTYSGGTWAWTDGDTGTTESYESFGAGNFRLKQITDAEGHHVKLAYDGAGLISTLSTFKAGSGSVADEVVTLTYSGTLLSKITTSYKDELGVLKTRSATSYSYESNRLSKVTTDLTPENSVVDADIYTVSYGYDVGGRLQSITQKDGSRQFVEYQDGRVKSIAEQTVTEFWPDGRVKTVREDRKTNFLYNTVDRITTITDSLNQVTTLKYYSSGESGKLEEISGSLLGGVSFKQSYTYTNGDVQTSTNAKGEVTTYEYAGGAGKLSRRTDAAGNVMERTYTTFGLLASETTYSIADADGVAGPLMAGGARTTRFIYDTNQIDKRRLAYVIGPQGEVTRYSYNAEGQVSGAVQYTSELYTAPNPTFTALETWANGVQQQSLDRQVTDYTYDFRGQVKEEIRYATQTLVGASVVNGGGVKTVTTYDAFGRLLSKKDHNGNGTTYLYDGLNRLTKTVDADQAITLYTYDDANRKTSVKLHNGQTTVQMFDAMGRLVSSDVLGAVGQSLLGATKYFYDALGQLRRVQDATGVASRSSYSLYDASGRKSADIAANGQLTEYLYDGAGQLIQTVVYANLVTDTKLATLSDAQGLPTTKTVGDMRPVADEANDRITTFYYDKAGRLVGTLDADGYLTKNTYDGTSALTEQKRYANAVGVTRLSVAEGTTRISGSILPAPTEDAARDRLTRNLYDNSGRLRARVDGDGGLTVWAYDAAGNMLSQLRRSQLLSDAERTGAQLAALVGPTPLADDEFTQWVYDTAGRQIAMLDAEGYLTEYRYDTAGRPTDTVRYLSLAKDPVGSGLNLIKRADLATLRAGLTKWETTSRSYNSRGLLEKETAADGTVTFYEYDKLQRLKSKTLAQGSGVDRKQTVTYDDWGRVQFTQTEGDGAGVGVTTTYDAAGRRTSVTDARGNATFFYYDAYGRQVYAILRDPLKGGEVTETIYSSFNEVQATVTHAMRLSTDDSTALAGGHPDATLAAKVLALSDASVDNRTTVNYNRRGLISQAIDALGYKTDTRYNAFGQVDNTIVDTGTAASGLRRRTTTYTYDRRGDIVRRELSGTGVSNVFTQAQYDALGRLDYAIDERTQTTDYVYLRNTGDGRQVTVRDPAGDITTSYDALERVVRRIDRNNHTVRYTYDAVTRKMTMKTEEGVEVTTEATVHGQVYQVKDAFGATTYSYDAHGNLLTSTDALGNVIQNGYDRNDNLIRVVRGLKSNGSDTPTDDGSAVTASYSFDAANRVLTQTVDPDGTLKLKTSYEYDGQGLKTKITDPRGTVTTQKFTAKGELREVIVDDVEGGLKLKTSYSYDAESRVLTVIEGDGTLAARKTEYKYDAFGRRTQEIVDPNGIALSTYYEYDAAGHVVVKRNNLSQVVGRFVYDAAGRLLDSIDGTGAVTRNVYDKGELKATLSLPTRLGAGWTADSDSALTSRINALIDGGEAVNLYVYDKDGRLSHTVNAAGEVSRRIYDKANRVVETVRYNTKLSSPTAATVGVLATQVTQIADLPEDQHSYARYDDIGRLSYSVDATLAVSKFEYDRNGNVLKQIRYANRLTVPPAAGSDPTVAPDPAKDRVDHFLYDSAGRERFHVDAEGYVTETIRTDADGIVITRRLVERLAFSGTPTASAITAMSRTGADTTGRLLDRAGRLSVESRNGVRTVTAYDEAGRVKSVTQAEGLSEQTITTYSYNSAGQRTATTVADGTDVAATTQFQYDSRGNLQRVIDPRAVPLSTGDGAWERAERKRLGYMEKLSDVSDGAKLTLSNIYSTTYNYDEMGRVKETKHYLDTYTQATTVTEYDAFGNASVITDPRGYKSYQVYDKANRLVQSVNAERYLTVYGYDAFGNLKSTREVDAKVNGTLVLGRAVVVSATPPGNGQAYVPTNDSTDSYVSNTYDKANRLLTRTESASSTQSYAEGTSDPLSAFGERLTVFNKLGGVATYSYDKLGRLTKEVLPVKSTNENGVEATDAQGNKWVTNEYEYDGRGNRIKSIEAKGFAEQRVIEMRYDENNRLTHRIGVAYTATSADGTTSAVTPVDYTGYDKLGRVIEVIRRGNWSGSAVVAGVGARSLTYYSKRGDVIASIAADGAYTTYTLDAAGNVVTESAQSTLVALPASAGGTPPATTYVGGRDRVTLRRYDQLNRVIEVQMLDVRYWESTGADDSNFTTALQNPGVVTMRRFAYDMAGNVVQDTDARGNSVFKYYDGLGRQTLNVDQEGYATAWTFDRHFKVATRQTRYAGALLASQYTRQDDMGKNPVFRDPVGILQNLSPVDKRTTEYDLDLLGRVTEQRVLDVDTSVVGADGTIGRSLQSAHTKYSYNGLGALTQVSELVGRDSGADKWNTTDIEYDKLGREIHRVSPSFTDHRGESVRPIVDKKYDGLGAVTRVIQVGEKEADDRITSYVFDHKNGDLIGTVDANNNRTTYAIDAAGKTSRVTVSVKDADGFVNDVVKTYAYDRLGRVVATKDIGTGEVRRTRYNAFGEVEAQGLGASDAWQERIDYNVLGKIVRSNSGDGVAKLYLYDRNGNTTRQISSTGSDLYEMSLDAAATDSTLIHSFSAYDKRNLLIKTADIKISYLQDKTTLSSAFTKQLTDLYGAITVAPPDPLKNLPTEVKGTGGTFYANPNTGGAVSSPYPTSAGLAEMGRVFVESAPRTGPPNDVAVAPGSGPAATYLLFSANLLPTRDGVVYVRRPGIGDWATIGIAPSGGQAISGGLPGGEGQWAIIVASSDGRFYRTTYTVTNGVASVDRAMTGELTALNPRLNIPLAHSTALSSQSQITIDIRLNHVSFTAQLNGQALTVNGVALDATYNGSTLSFSWNALKALRLGIDEFSTRSISYDLTVYGAPTFTTERRNILGSASGTCQAGCDGTQNVASTVITQTKYFPWVQLPFLNDSIQGWIDLKDEGNGQYSGLPKLDLRRYDSGSNTLINLQDFVPASGTRTITVTFTANAYGSSVTYKGYIDLQANGYASLRGLNAPAPGVILKLPGGAKTLSVLRLLRPGQGDPRFVGGNLTQWCPPTGNPGEWTWPVYTNQTGQWNMYYEALGADGTVVAKGTGWYYFEADGSMRSAEVAPDVMPDYLTLTPPANTADFTLKYRVKGTTGDWITVTRGNGLIIDGNRLKLSSASLLPPNGGNMAEYEFTYEAKTASGGMLSKGGGEFQVLKFGAVVPTKMYQDRVPLQPIVFKGTPGRADATYMRVTYTPVTGGQETVVNLVGTWVSTPLPGYFQYIWDKPFDGRSITSEESYNIKLELCKDTNGTPVLDEADNAIVTRGVMKVGGVSEKPWEIKQTVVSITKDAQIKRFQTWNAFGEIASEFDERVLERALAQVAFYNSKADLKGATPYVANAAAVTTRFTYNTLGKLVRKTEAETFETLQNGFIRRTQPVTEYGYDLLGRLTFITDANLHTNKVRYDGEGEANRTQWAADGGQASKAFTDIFGDVRLLENQLGAKTEQEYDKLGQLTKVRRKDVQRVQNYAGTVTLAPALVTSDIEVSYGYDALGRRISYTNALRDVEKTWYDDLGRVTKTRSAALRETSYAYDFFEAKAPGGVLGVGGENIGGYRVTTFAADGRQTVDKKDYFGRTTWHRDLAGRQYTYNYNMAGQLKTQTSTFGQSLEYNYLQNGMLAETLDKVSHILSRYGYDDAGNRTSESYIELLADNATIKGSFQTSTIAYDELNRIVHVWDGTPVNANSDLFRTHDVRYEYDAVGNRRMVDSIYWNGISKYGAAELLDRQTYWYSYDAMDRFTVSKGSLKGGQRGQTASSTVTIEAGTQGTTIGYDWSGQRRLAEYTYAGQPISESYDYSADGYLQATSQGGVLKTVRELDAQGRTVKSRDLVNKQVTTSLYDADNRLTQQKLVDSIDSAKSYTLDYSYYGETTDTSVYVSSSGNGALAKTVMTPTNSPGSTTTTTYRYEYWESALQSVVHKSSSSSPTPGSLGKSTFGYDVNGRISQSRDEVANVTNTYKNNATGLVLQRERVNGSGGKSHHFFYYADDNRIGDVSDTPDEIQRVSYAEQLAMKNSPNKRTYYRQVPGAPVPMPPPAYTGYPINWRPGTYQPMVGASTADFDQNYEPINDNYPGAAASGYTVRNEGESLYSIAQALWGDRAMWYLIADANGLTATSSLKAGQVLTIPNKVTNIHNNSTTWRPYNPGEAIGRTDPTMKAPPPPSKKGCGTVGTIIMVVVAVVATVVTAGAAAAALAGASSLFAGSAVVIGATSMSVLGAAAATAVGAAVGSIASQAVGMAMGNVDQFSWKAVGQAALGGAVTGGIGAYANSAGSALSSLSSNGWAASAGKAALSSAATMALKGDWSWRNVALSAVSAGAGSAVSDAVGGQDWAKVAGGFGGRMAGGLAGGLAARALTGGSRASYATVFASTLGNAIGESLASNSKPADVPASANADNRTLLNAAERAADPDRFTTTVPRDWFAGTKLSGNGNGLQLGDRGIPLGDSNDGPLELPTIKLSGGRYADASGNIRKSGTVTVSEPLTTVGYLSAATSRLDSKLQAFTPSGMTTSDGSPVTYSFDQVTGQAYWNVGSDDYVRAIPKAFKQPSLMEAAHLDPNNPFALAAHAGDILTDFTLLGIGGGVGAAVTLPAVGLAARGLMSFAADTSTYGLHTAYLMNASGVNTAGLVGAELAFGYEAMSPSVALPSLSGKVISTARSGQLAELLPVESLTKRQLAIHTELAEAGSTGIFRKRDVSMNDLVAVGRVTGDEYSMFTNKGSRLIIRGDGSDVVVSTEMYSDLLAGKYGRFSGHTHPPGYSVMPGPEDRPFLASLGQERSTIWGYDGTRYTFGQHGLADDSRITTEIARKKWMRLYGLD